ncbi:MAG: tRNA (adenosine(37)-N6)-dimethylallyltransferase MiaA [Sphingobacteriaceae bacterium]|nr:tRNA (adenosine(37)-N6)-dimethylallyltransferase MiaA [Sphingobacteriaceae bacterium]
MPDKTLIVIAGPTAIGKTALAIKLAQHFKTEIISADSRQFYREMEIGTAKPSLPELNTVKHHFINSLSVTDEFSVGDFEAQGLATLDSIFNENTVAILVGGSGLYIKAITEGFDNLPKGDTSVRQELNQSLAEEGITSLQEKLKILDPDYYAEVDLSNPQRVIRALEVCITSGKPFSSFRSNQQKTRPFNSIRICLDTDRQKLYTQINTRVDQMLEAGLLDEVKSLIPYRHLNALNTVGYSEIFEYLDDKISLEQAVENIKQNTRRFAKRQLTWFRKDREMRWFDPENSFDKILNHISQSLPL